LIKAGKRIGLRTGSEVFADRTYEEDGTLTPRWIEGAVMSDENEAVQQVLRMVKEKKCVPDRERMLKFLSKRFVSMATARMP